MKTELTDGSPVPEDNSHTRLRPDGQQVGYVVLSPEERAAGYIQPVRTSYMHKKCGGSTKMGRALAETYAVNPWFYSGTFCARCHGHFVLSEFLWDGGGEMCPTLWSDEDRKAVESNRARRDAQNG